MTDIYKKYKKLNIDATPIGFAPGAHTSDYFCTPKGATVIGWAGVDGIHFCRIRGFGEMVFAVSPMNAQNDYVHPLAETFAAFLRLLLACGDTAGPEQAHGWKQVQFDAFLQENPPSAVQTAVLDTIREQLSLTPMEHPFAYLKSLQAKFDYSTLTYKDDYYEWVPAPPKMTPWKVYFDGNFCGHHGNDRSGKEVILKKWFDWDGEAWYVPAAYSCSKGLVIDFCKRIDPQKIRAFMERVQRCEADSGNISEEQMQQLESENPTVAHFKTTVQVNNRLLEECHGSGTTWNPCLRDEDTNSPEAKMVVDHYGLDQAMGWLIHRVAFPWATKRKPELKTLNATLTPYPVTTPGPHFRTAAPFDTVTFTHPTTGVQHTLTVLEYEQQELSQLQLGSEDLVFPTHYHMMCYTLSPDLPNDEFMISDCIRNDQPRQMRTEPYSPQATGDIAMIGVIGGADGPTAICMGVASQARQHVACSALHFVPASDVEWRIAFREKKRTDIAVALIEA